MHCPNYANREQWIVLQKKRSFEVLHKGHQSCRGIVLVQVPCVVLEDVIMNVSEIQSICFKQHFDTRYLAFYNLSPPRMFLPLDLLSEYQIQHGAIGPAYVTSSNSTWIFCRGVSGFATDCPCGVWCRGLTTCLLHVCPPFGNRLLNNSWAVGLT